MTNASRKKVIREIMVQTGMSWTAAMCELERRRQARQEEEQAQDRGEETS